MIKERLAEGLCIELIDGGPHFCTQPHLKDHAYCQEHADEDAERMRQWIDHCENGAPQPPGTSHVTLRGTSNDEWPDVVYD